jgi:copper chaperone CopZ
MKKQLFVAFAIIAMMVAGCQSKTSSGNKEVSATETIQPSAELTQLNLKVTGMTCEGCEKTIKTGLANLEGIASVEASFKDSLVTAQIDPTKVTPAKIKETITNLGYTVAE